MAGASATAEVHNPLSRDIAKLGYGMGDLVPTVRKQGDEWYVEVCLPGERTNELNRLLLSNEEFREKVNRRIENILGNLRAYEHKRNQDGELDFKLEEDLLSEIKIDTIWTKDGLYFLANGGTAGKLTPCEKESAYSSDGIKNADIAVMLFIALSVYMQELLHYGDITHLEGSVVLDTPLMVRIRPRGENDPKEEPIVPSALPPKVERQGIPFMGSKAREERGNMASTKIAEYRYGGGFGEVIPTFDKTHNGYFVGMNAPMQDLLQKWILRVNGSRSFRQGVGSEMLQLLNESQLLRYMRIEVMWDPLGPIIDCAGNATGVYPCDSSGTYPGTNHLDFMTRYKYAGHNVDSSMQVAALVVPLLIYLRHFYNALELCEKDPDSFNDSGQVGRHHFIAKRNMLDLYDETDYAFVR